MLKLNFLLHDNLRKQGEIKWHQEDENDQT